MLKLDHNSVMYSVRTVSIHGPKNISAANTPTIFGMKVSVCSWIDVTVWKILIIRPIRRDTSNNGNDVINRVYILSRIMSKTCPSVITYSLLKTKS